jgi:hypothetical protein
MNDYSSTLAKLFGWRLMGDITTDEYVTLVVETQRLLLAGKLTITAHWPYIWESPEVLYGSTR